MTVPSATNKAGPYSGNGVTTVFAYGFRILDATHIQVVTTTAGVDTIVSASAYSVSGVGNTSGGDVTFTTAPATGTTVNLIRSAPFTQGVDLENQGAYYAETIEEALDLSAMRDQQLQEQLDRSLKIPVGADASSLDALIEDVIRLGDSVDNIDTVAGISGNVTTVAGIAGNVTTVAGVAADVPTVAGVSVNVTTVAGIAPNVTTVAGIAPNVTTVAGVSADVTTVAGISANVTTVAGISADVTTVAANVADVTNFSDVYLGPAAANPTLRNDGTALQVGDLYFNTVANQVRVYDGAAWTAPTYDSTNVAISGGTIDGTEIGGTTPAAVSGTTGTFSGDVTLPSINGGPLAGFRNAIINGNFDHWQEGTSFVGATSRYVADVWYAATNGATLSRQAFTLGQTDVPGEPQYFLRFQETAGTGTPSLRQHIEGVRSFAGQTVTISFYAKASAALSATPQLQQLFGTGGSPSANVVTSGAALNIGTTWAKHTVTLTVPSIAGKTIGTDGNDSLQLDLALPTATFTFDIAKVQIEEGSVATPFERRPVGTELALCERYYEQGQAEQGVYMTSGGFFNFGTPFRSVKRVTPTISLSNINYSFSSGLTADRVTDRSFRLFAQAASTSSVAVDADWSADARL